MERVSRKDFIIYVTCYLSDVPVPSQAKTTWKLRYLPVPMLGTGHVFD